MKKQIIKMSALVTGLGIAASAMVTGGIARAQNAPTTAPSSEAGSASAQSIAALGGVIIEYLQKTFVTSTDDYKTALSNTAKFNAIQAALPAAVKPQATRDNDAFIQKTALYVPNALTVQQKYAQLVPTTQDQVQQKAAYFNGSSLLNATTLSSQEVAAATSYINFVAGAGIPIQTPSGSWLTNGSSSTTSYLNSLGTYTAELSNGTNVLFNLLQERVGQKGLNGQSAIEYDAAAANRRMSPTWTGSVANMSPADMQREQLIIDAEMRYELYQNRMQLEQLNATMATLQLQLLQVMTKPAVIAAAASAVKQGTSTS